MRLFMPNQQKKKKRSRSMPDWGRLKHAMRWRHNSPWSGPITELVRDRWPRDLLGGVASITATNNIWQWSVYKLYKNHHAHVIYIDIWLNVTCKFLRPNLFECDVVPPRVKLNDFKVNRLTDCKEDDDETTPRKANWWKKIALIRPSHRDVLS